MMKKITVLLLLMSFSGEAQIKGNKDIETRTFPINNIEKISINLYAKITIDQSLTEGLTITTDSNLFDFIDKEMNDGALSLDQKKWISASQDIIIKIGAPNLKVVESGTHDTTRIININNDKLRVNAPIGNIIIEGKTKELRLGAELSTIDASKIEAEDAYVNLWSYGKVTVNVSNLLWAEISNDGKLFYTSKPEKLEVKTKNGGRIYNTEDNNIVNNTDAQFIKFKIKNNSSNRNQFYVVGPKPDGSKFSYGFPMMPYSKRKENWSVGSKVYKVNRLGFKKLLISIVKENEGETINLF